MYTRKNALPKYKNVIDYYFIIMQNSYGSELFISKIIFSEVPQI